MSNTPRPVVLPEDLQAFAEERVRLVVLGRRADAVAAAAGDQARSADAALVNVRHEVRVGVKPALDLLDAEREALAAKIADVQAQGARTVAAYRLKAAVGQ